MKDNSLKENGKGVEDTAAFNNLMNNFMRYYVFVRMRNVYFEMQQLNTGELEGGIENLSTDINVVVIAVLKRNLGIYSEIKTILIPFLKLIDFLQKANVGDAIEQLKELKKEDFVSANNKVIEDIKKQLNDVKIKFLKKDEKEKEIKEIIGYFRTYLDKKQARIERLQEVAAAMKEAETTTGDGPDLGMPPPPPPPPPK